MDLIANSRYDPEPDGIVLMVASYPKYQLSTVVPMLVIARIAINEMKPASIAYSIKSWPHSARSHPSIGRFIVALLS
jgi:hypothetical protein